MEWLEKKREEIEKSTEPTHFDMTHVVKPPIRTDVSELTRIQKHVLSFPGTSSEEIAWVRSMAALLNWKDVPASDSVVLNGPLRETVAVHSNLRDTARVMILSDTKLMQEDAKMFPKLELLEVHDTGVGPLIDLKPVEGFTALKELVVYGHSTRPFSLKGYVSRKPLTLLRVKGDIGVFPDVRSVDASTTIHLIKYSNVRGLCEFLESLPISVHRLSVDSLTPIPMTRLLLGHRAKQITWRDTIVGVSDTEKTADDSKARKSETEYELIHLFSHAAAVEFLSSRVYAAMRLSSVRSFGICTPLYSTLPKFQMLEGQLLPWRQLWHHVLVECKNQSLRDVFIEVPQGSHLDQTYLYIKLMLDMALVYVSRAPVSNHPFTLCVHLRPHVDPLDSTSKWEAFTKNMVDNYQKRLAVKTLARIEQLTDSKTDLTLELDWLQMNCPSEIEVKLVAGLQQANAPLIPLTVQHLRATKWLEYTVAADALFRSNSSGHSLSIVVEKHV